MFGLFKVNKIRKMRENLSNSKWLIDKYESLLYNDKELTQYEKFECEPHFKGYKLAELNKRKLKVRRFNNNRRIKFIQSIIKEVNLNYYLKYIGSLSEDQIKVLKRDNKLKKLINK
jgi:hypothetical protein